MIARGFTSCDLPGTGRRCAEIDVTTVIAEAYRLGTGGSLWLS